MSLYFCEGYYNYFFGVMPISTGFIKLFDIMKYNNGFLIRYPSKKEPNKIMPYEETKKLLRTLDEYDDIYKALGVCNIDKINKIIREGKAKELILISEALHEKKISQIADQVAKIKKKNNTNSRAIIFRKDNICKKVRNTAKIKRNKTKNNFRR